MPFGTRNPFTYTPPTGVTLIPLEDEFTCPVCGKDLTDHNQKASKCAMAPCIVPKEPSMIHDQKAIFACNSCYNTYRHNFFGFVEEFKDAVAAKKPRRSRVQAVSTVKESDAIEVLRKIFVMLRPMFEDVNEASRTMPQKANEASSGVCEIDYNDDLEAGMTDEQRARMNQAVEEAERRTKEIVIGG